MKQTVEKELGLSRAQLRSLNAYAVPKTNIDRQKLLVSLMQEYLRHLTDSIRGEYRDRIMVQNPGVRMYTAALKIFEEFQFNVSRWFCRRYVC
jgi:interferon-induced GTP-binding protein Mx1